MEGKRIVFSTASPNDQGGIIPNNTIDFSRFKKNPVILCQHDWNAPPLGIMTDIREEGGQWTGLPEFHGITKESQEYRDMYLAGHLRACSIGGEAEWETNNAGQMKYDRAGNRVCEKFVLYEISLVSLPSNADAVQLSAAAAVKFYEKSELQAVSDSIVLLSTKYVKNSPMSEVKPGDKQQKYTAAQLREMLTAAETEERERLSAIGGGLSNSDPSVSQNTEVIRQIITNHAEDRKQTFGLLHAFLGFLGLNKNGKTLNSLTPPAQTGEPESTIVEPEMVQPTPTGLTAEQKAAKEKAEKALNAAITATDLARAAKLKAEAANASKAEKDAYSAALLAANAAYEAALTADEEYKACMESEDGEGEPDMSAKKEKEKSKNAAGSKATKLASTEGAAGQQAAPKVKTIEQLQAENIKLAPKPEEIRMKQSPIGRTTFSKLSAKDNEEGGRILGRVLAGGTGSDGEASIQDYMTVLSAIASEPKFAAFVSKFRFHSVSTGQYDSVRKHDNLSGANTGMNLKHIFQQLQSGVIGVKDRNNTMHQVTTLGAARELVKLDSSDNALAAPALNAIEWLAMAIFNMYPSSDWKIDIPQFAAEMTSKNLGLIWPNITADPTIFWGNKPVNPADYEEPDEAVAVALASSWLQPMTWTPHDLHTIRYDKMGTNWAQAFAKWGSIIDDYLIYVLASTVPAASIYAAPGQRNPDGPGATFSLTGANDPNNFYYNPALIAQLGTPAWADIAKFEQIYAKQNFDLNKEKIRLVIDPTQDYFISQDPDTKSLLTRFTESDGVELLKIKHTKLNERSRVAIWDPATQQVKDPRGAIPGTAVSAALSLVSSQVALAIGYMDVFAVQDPSVYAFRMSANTRQGAVPIHYTFRGTGLYTYGAPVNP